MRMTDGASGKRQEQRAVSSPMGEQTSPFRNEFAIAMSDPITPRMNKMETKKRRTRESPTLYDMKMVTTVGW